VTEKILVSKISYINTADEVSNTPMYTLRYSSSLLTERERNAGKEGFLPFLKYIHNLIITKRCARMSKAGDILDRVW
jgi:hypothetical protein